MWEVLGWEKLLSQSLLSSKLVAIARRGLPRKSLLLARLHWDEFCRGATLLFAVSRDLLVFDRF
jgi:hypothetical protein